MTTGSQPPTTVYEWPGQFETSPLTEWPGHWGLWSSGPKNATTEASYDSVSRVKLKRERLESRRKEGKAGGNGHPDREEETEPVIGQLQEAESGYLTQYINCVRQERAMVLGRSL